ncbi:hypothetical protein [Achromobacter xylosoxidans]|uniref:Uncharacterized protein n=1 Tax=Alcaligenes xylosoxydans xylosoxydans TaxID=85698 RepID=A0A1R1JSG7_ALCXX|nr:hypothetical protein [Achromobacter xylosoxidans]OMG85419.1 hypothetical protein BIZ92_27110 [Achromobacter xylosoxidans]
MNKINDGGPAFPNVPEGAGSRWADWDMGMTLRDYFAAKAMQGWLSSYGPDDKHPATAGDADFVAQRSYAMADAMLAARGAQ